MAGSGIDVHANKIQGYAANPYRGRSITPSIHHLHAFDISLLEQQSRFKQALQEGFPQIDA
jgi:hypothetical protein